MAGGFRRPSVTEVFLRMPRVGLGGEGILRTFEKQEAAQKVIAEAYSKGIRYFDTARAYAGSESYFGTFWKDHQGTRNEVFQTSKSASRTYEGAMADLEQSLRTLGLDRLDLWQIHDIRSMNEIRAIGKPGGALEAFIDAREAGIVSYIGVTGHYDPSVLTYAVDHWPIDCVLLPVNPVEACLGGFLDGTTDAALRRGVEVIGMKTLGAAHYLFPGSGITAKLLLRYALSQPVSRIVVGCSSPEEVAVLASVAQNFVPMTPEEQERLVERLRPQAEKLAYYRGNL